MMFDCFALQTIKPSEVSWRCTAALWTEAEQQLSVLRLTRPVISLGGGGAASPVLTVAASRKHLRAKVPQSCVQLLVVSHGSFS